MAHPRYPVSLPVKLRDEEGQRHKGLAISIGDGGLFAQLEARYPKGASLHVDFGIGKTHGRVQSDAKVVYRDLDHGEQVREGLGLAFEDPPVGLGRRLALFNVDYPGASDVDDTGRIIWPLNEGADDLLGPDEEACASGTVSSGSRDRSPPRTRVGTASRTRTAGRARASGSRSSTTRT